MARYKFNDLKTKYEDFYRPIAVVKINDKQLPNDKLSLTVGDYDIDLTSGFEASIASFSIMNCYSRVTGTFDMDNLKNYIMLGSKVEIFTGYGRTATCVFKGLIAKVNYQYLEDDLPCVRITAMDVKGIMMAGSYSMQLKATEFTAAVKEIFDKSVYQKLKASGIINDIKIGSTMAAAPQVGTGGSKDVTIEMVAESDYEFVVKMAKKNNYDFFIDCGDVIFRKAKADTTPLIVLTPTMGVRSFDIEYDITGLSETVCARGIDTGKGQVIEVSNKFSNKISIGNKAKNMIKGSKKIYIDPTIHSKDEAEVRMNSLMEDMSYRFGTIYLDCVGIPELRPGYYLDMQCMGEGPSNIFYMTNVRHILNDEGRYITRITGKSNAIVG